MVTKLEFLGTHQKSQLTNFASIDFFLFLECKCRLNVHCKYKKFPKKKIGGCFGLSLISLSVSSPSFFFFLNLIFPLCFQKYFFDNLIRIFFLFPPRPSFFFFIKQERSLMALIHSLFSFPFISSHFPLLPNKH